MKTTALLAVVCVAPFTGCATLRDGRTGPERESRTSAEIADVLHRQAERWNEGDVDGYMAPYWRSPEMTFTAGGKVTRGFEETTQRFRTAYPDRAAMGRLTFSELEISPLGRDAAWVMGRWKLDASTNKSGIFSLVMRRIDGQWMIVHDHTSRDAA